MKRLKKTLQLFACCCLALVWSSLWQTQELCRKNQAGKFSGIVSIVERIPKFIPDPQAAFTNKAALLLLLWIAVNGV